MTKRRVENIHQVVPLSLSPKILSPTLFIRSVWRLVVSHSNFVHSLAGNLPFVDVGELTSVCKGFSFRDLPQKPFKPARHSPAVPESPHVIEIRTGEPGTGARIALVRYEVLRGNQPSANHHHAGFKQAAAHLAFTQKQACPQDSEDDAELEEGGHIPNEAKRNGGEAKERGDSCQCNGGELDHLLLFPQSEHPLRRCGLIGRGMRVISFEHDEVTQPARLELIGGGVEDAAIGELVPAVPPAHASVEQAQASPLTCPAELHLKRRRHPSAASVVGAAVAASRWLPC